MSLKLSFGIAEKATGMSNLNVPTPALFTRDDSFYLNKTAMNDINLSFKKGLTTKVAIIRETATARIAIVNASNAILPKNTAFTIRKNGKFNYAPLYSVIESIIERSDHNYIPLDMTSHSESLYLRL